MFLWCLKPQVSSIRNILAAEVVEWIEDGEQVDVKLDLEKNIIYGRGSLAGQGMSFLFAKGVKFTRR